MSITYLLQISSAAPSSSNKPTSPSSSKPTSSSLSSSTTPFTNCRDEPMSLGCWKDTYNRAISGGIRMTTNNPRPIEDCQKFAASRGYKVFAVQYGRECFTSLDAHQTYKKYGRSTACSTDGRGGDWAQNVYQISCIKGKRLIILLYIKPWTLNDRYCSRGCILKKD